MIRNLQYTPFSADKVRPSGWLKKQLLLQAEGLSGNLDRIWPDVRDSLWIGGSRHDWERAPYWLDGFIPLAWLLDDEGMKARAKRYIDGILARQAEDGWLCPCKDGERFSYDTWAVLLLCKVLALYCDITGDKRTEEALCRCLKQFSSHIDGATLRNWGAARWFEGLIPIFWLYERRPEEWLILLAKKLDVQGFDWEKVFDSGMLDELTESWDYFSHVVNLAMMLKSRALMSRITGEDPDRFAKKALHWLREHHGMACGHFTGDENLSGDSPVQGSELCGVVEAMYSFETLFSVSGDPYWLDQLEKEAFNALPAAFTPDMWAHQYVQLTNQVECSRLPEKVFRSNNEEAHLFGLEPHFGCCTANMGQGFPKLALSAFMRHRGGIASTMPLPASVLCEIDGVRVICECLTEYPFREEIRYRVTTDAPVAFPFTIRIPSSAERALLEGREVPCGQTVTIERTWEGLSELDLHLVFRTHFEERPRSLFALWHGPLLFSLPIPARIEKREYEKNGVLRKYPYCDYEIYPEAPWNYGFADRGYTLIKEDYDAPFRPDKPPLRLAVRLAPIPWAKPDGRCAPLPDSNRAQGDAEIRTLIPYGCTLLRMTEMPFTEEKQG